MTNLSVIVSYCSLDKKFIKPLIKQLLLFTDDIILTRFDKLLNGEHEKLDDLEDIRQYSPQKIKILYLPYVEGETTRYYHNLLRWEGMKYTKYNSLLFLDSDEIPDGRVIKLLLEKNGLEKIQAGSFGCHWYFRSAINQAHQKEECGLYIQKGLITQKLMFTEMERWSFKTAKNIKFASGISLQEGPFVHHYSWARTKEEMLTKVSAWGHKNDKNWSELIEEEFSRDFNGTDFVHGYSYDQVPDYFEIGI